MGPLLPAVLAAILSQGCAPPYRIAPRLVTFTPDSAADPYWANAAPRDPKTVVTTEGGLTRPHTKMGRIKVESKGLDTNLSLDRLRLEAAQKGLDAVILVNVSKTSTGGSSNEAINYFFPPVVRHTIEGVGVLFTQPPAPEAPPAPAPQKEEPALPPPAAPPAPPAPKYEPPPAAPIAPVQPIIEAPSPPVPKQELPPPPPPEPSKYAPLPPPDVFTDEHK